MNSYIRKKIFSIIYILSLLGFTTWFIFGPREKIVYAAMSINDSKAVNKNIVINSKDILNYNKDTYNFSVTNKRDYKSDYEIILVNDYRKSILKDCKVLSNNYLKYHIKESDNYSVEKNVRKDGTIYKDEIKPYETKHFSMKLWIDKEKSKKDCYYPILKIEEK